MSSVTTRARLPTRPRRYRFMMTPLADAMFQLLLFFMLSSSLTPYSLITIRSAVAPVDPDALPPGAGGDGTDPAAAMLPANAVIWSVDAGELTAGGQAFSMGAVAQLAEALAGDPLSPTVILVVRDTARVEDVTVALEALRAAGIDAVQITSGAG